MGSADSRKVACRAARGALDAHVSSELDAEAGREMREHLSVCAPCATLLEERLRVRDLLRRAARGVESPPRLAGAIRAMIRQG